MTRSFPSRPRRPSGRRCRCRRCCWGCWAALAYLAPLFGRDMLPGIEQRLVSTSNSIFSPNVVHEIIEPTIADIDRGARGEVVSVGFLLSLWAGSSAISAFVDSVVKAHDQTPLRHPVRQRLFALASICGDAVLRDRHRPAVGAWPAEGSGIPPRRLGQLAAASATTRRWSVDW